MSNKNRNHNNPQQELKEQLQQQQQSTQDQQQQDTNLNPDQQQPQQDSLPQDNSTVDNPQPQPELDTAAATLPVVPAADTATDTSVQQEAVQQLESVNVQEPPVVKETPQEAPKRPGQPQRQLGRGTPLVQAMPETASVEDYFQKAIDTKNLSMQVLIDNLQRLEKSLNHKTLPFETVARSMVGLHTCLTNVINDATSIKDFEEKWNIVLKFFEENKTGGMGDHRLYRGVAHWPRTQDEYRHLQSLINLIKTTNDTPREKLSTVLNFGAVMAHPVSDAGRGRLSSFYSLK